MKLGWLKITKKINVHCPNGGTIANLTTLTYSHEAFVSKVLLMVNHFASETYALSLDQCSVIILWNK